MDTLPSSAQSGNNDALFPSADPSYRHYVYILAYPESMGGTIFYVGKGTRRRINAHELEAKQGKQSYKCNVIRKIWAAGEHVQKRKLAYFATHKEACDYEIALIFFLDGLTNLTAGGDGTVGVIPSDEVRIRRNRKISEANKDNPRVLAQLAGLREKQKGIPRTQEVRNKIREKLLGQPGHPHTADEKRKISEANKGRVSTEKMRLAVAEANRIRVFSDESRRRMSENRKGKTRRPCSEETRRKISEAQLHRTALKRIDRG